MPSCRSTREQLAVATISSASDSEFGGLLILGSLEAVPVAHYAGSTILRQVDARALSRLTRLRASDPPQHNDIP